MSTRRRAHQVLMQLGEGGMGVVRLAATTGPQDFLKLVVLKSLRRELLGDPAARQMFLDEARISARISHPNVVQVHEVMEFEGSPTMVMEYLQGRTLHALADHHPPFPIHLHLLVLVKVLAGLHACHELRQFDGTPLDLIHRDVSPQNVFVLYDGQVRVLDFGIAKARASSTQTQTGEVKGKLHYMAPEQFAARQQTRAVDIFAVGVMLWEALAQQRMWAGKHDSDVMLALLTNQIPPLPESVSIDPELRVICTKATAASVDDRFATAADFQRALEKQIPKLSDDASQASIAAFMEREFQEARQAEHNLIDSHLKRLEVSAHEPSAATAGDGRTSTLPLNETRTNLTRTELRSPDSLGRYRLVSSLAAIAAVLAIVGVGVRAIRPTPIAASADSKGAPALVCAPGSKPCEGKCVSKDLPDYGCGSSSCEGCEGSNATLRCDFQQRCDVAACHRGFENCDGNVTNGCETDIRLDPDNCGSCGHRCPDLPNAERGCGDICTILRCQPGYRDCNGNTNDGCEVHAAEDPQNCGHCGLACKSGESCRQGTCTRGGP